MNAKLRRVWMDIAGWDNLDAWIRKLPGDLPYKVWKIIEKESHNKI
jgi:hypothetical protein